MISVVAFYVKSYAASKKTDEPVKNSRGVQMLDGMCFSNIHQKTYSGQFVNENSNEDETSRNNDKFGQSQRLLSKAKILT
jgi:hypothetical protein